MRARRRRRISSSLLPENMGPHTTSIQPIGLVTISIGRYRIQDVIHCLRGRVLLPEILDTLSPDEARASLRDLTRLNRQWGGHSTLRRLLGEVVQPNETFSLLDVGAASGDMGDRIREWYPRATVTSLDRLPSHLETARAPRVAADAFALPFRAKSFDF